MPIAGPDGKEGPVPGEGQLAFPAAMAQEAFYYLEQMRQGAVPFNVAVRFHLAGSLDIPRLERAFNAIIERHESLRTQFEEEQGELLQIVQPSAEISLEVADIRYLPAEERASELERLGKLEANKPFDLAKAPLLRAGVIRLSDEECVLHVSAHHIVCDGWSVGVLTEELAAHYDAFGEGRTSPLPPLPIQYADFAVWQRDFLAGPEIATQIEYWKKQLQGYAETDLPADRPRPPVKQWNGDIVSELLPVELTDQLKALAQSRGATLFHVFLAAFQTLLHRYTGATDIAVGSPISGRNRAELEPLIGTFINSVVLRAGFSGHPDFYQVLGQVRETALEAVANQDVPFELLVRKLKPARDSSRNPLFQINFTHQRDFVKPVKLGGVQLTALPSVSPGTIFDFHLFMVERDGVWRASCDYSTDLFERKTALGILRHFRELLAGIAAAPDRPVGGLPMGDFVPPQRLAEPRHAAALPQDGPSDAQIERRLLGLWVELLQVPVIGPDDNFFDLGGHSLLGLRLFSRIRQDFGVSLPLAILLRAPTVRTMAAVLTKESSGEAGDADRIVATIQPNGNRPPFWCIHGGDGRAMIYRKIAPHLDTDRPLLGIESPVLFRSDAVKLDPVEQIAAEYIPVIRRRQPQGPYFLGGYSFGGVIAYEMARQLEAQGQKVALLVIFDTMNPQLVQKLSLPGQLESFWKMHSHSGIVSRVRGLYQRARNFWKAQADHSLPVRLGNLVRRIRGFLKERVRNEAGIFAPRAGEADSGVRDAQLIRACRWTMRDYHPGPFHGRVLLLKTPEQIHGPEIPRDYGWAEVATNLEIVDVPGEHMTLFDPENIGVLAEPLRARLRAADD